jgi:hypothetical protein
VDGKNIIKTYMPYYIFGGTIVVLGVMAYKNRKRIKKYIKKKFKRKKINK